MPTYTTLLSSDDLDVTRRQGRPGLLLLTFSPGGAASWGQGLAEAEDFTAIDFRARQPNWFCGADMDAACRLAAGHAADFERVIACGSDMGGYAALRWGQQAGAGVAASFSPQYSIDPVVVGFDRRHVSAFRPALHRGMEIQRHQVPRHSFVFLDPDFAPDRRHAELILRVAPRIALVPLFACGQDCIRAFAGRGLGAAMLDLCGSGDYDAIRRFAGLARRASAIRTVELATRATRRHSRTARRIFERHQAQFETTQKDAFVKLLENAEAEAKPKSPYRAASRPETGLSLPMNNEIPRLVHLHIPKTAGTALRSAFEQQFSGRLRVFPHWEEAKLRTVEPRDFDFYSGHIGFHTAERLGGDIVTVFRHPVDRYLSVYYFWRELFNNGVERSLNTKLAAKFSLDEFVHIRDQPGLIEEFENRATFQVAYGSSLAHRADMRLSGLTNDAIFGLATRNLETFKAVGIQEDMRRFVDRIASLYGVRLAMERVNVTQERAAVKDISVATRRAIQEWVYMDLELYQQALRIT